MLNLTQGELTIVIFVTVAIVSAPWWGRVGAAIGRRLGGQRGRPESGSD